jgi:DNA repair protein RecO (recombination protein O)
MQWHDEALVLSVRPHGETAAVVELFCREHGRHLGLIHGGRSRKLRPVLQVGNHVDATWRARTADQLGHFSVELRKGYAAQAMDSAAALAALSSMAVLLRQLAEREAHPSLFEVSMFLLGFLDDPTVWPALMVRWELALLGDLGFGLDLERCAATGTSDDLVYVSPKSGRAVCRTAGAPYADKLLPLPPFLAPGRKGPVGADEITAGFALTGHFLSTRVYGPGGLALPEACLRVRSLYNNAAPAGI